MSAPSLSGVTLLIDGETGITEREDVNTATEVAVWFEGQGTAGHFKVASDGLVIHTSAVLRALQNVGPGFTWELVNKNTTLVGGAQAAEFRIYDAAGLAADAVVDIELKGPKADGTP